MKHETLKQFEIIDPVTVWVLRIARDIIQRGWSQKHFYRDGKRCPLRALADARLSFRRPPYGDKSNEYLILAIGTKDIIRWNEAPGRTKEQVLAAFDTAIAKAKFPNLILATPQPIPTQTETGSSALQSPSHRPPRRHPA